MIYKNEECTNFNVTIETVKKKTLKIPSEKKCFLNTNIFKFHIQKYTKVVYLSLSNFIF